VIQNSATAAVELAPEKYLLLLDLTKAIASHRNLSELFHELANDLHQLFEFHNLSIMLHDEPNNLMRLYILETSEPAMREAPTEVPIEGSLAGLVWKSQQPFVSADLKRESRFTTINLIQRLPVRSVCTLPLTTAHERLGVMSIASDKIGAYDGIDLQFAQQVATQIAVAVETQRYQQQLARERDRSDLLLKINNMLVSNLNLRELLSAVSVCLRRVLPHDLAGLALYDPAIEKLRVVAMDFPSDESLFIEGEILPLDNSPAGVAFTEQRAVVHGATFPDGVRLRPRLANAGVKSGCLAPLISRGRALGILGVASLGENGFASDDADLLSEIAKQVAIAVENAIAFREIDSLKNKLAEEKLYLEEEIRTEYNFEEMIGGSPALKRVLQDVETVARTDSTVLIYGETGTGKELIARAIHNLGARRERTLVKVNCASIPSGLLESEMFGHEKGAFTGAIERRVGRFELAHEGTIFLDEVGDIPLELQPKLLRVLQEQEFERLGSSRTIRVDARVVAATNSDLGQMVAEKKFRGDLYYRLNVFPICLPPLRERREDIPLLVNFFANKFAQRMRKPIERIQSETMAVLVNYGWPGNIRELQNLIERAVIHSRGPVLEIPVANLKRSDKDLRGHKGGRLEDVEREHILKMLGEAGWVIGGPAGAAARLGLNRTTLNNRLRKLGITRPRV